MAVDVRFQYVHPTKCPRSIIYPERFLVCQHRMWTTDWEPCTSRHVMCSMSWIQHRPHITLQAAVVRHAPELQCNGMYDTRHEWLAIGFIFDILHSVMGPTTWSVSCCRPAVLLLAVLILLYCRIQSFIPCIVTYNEGTVWWTCTSYTFLRSFGRPAK